LEDSLSTTSALAASSYGGEVSYFLRVDFWQRGLAFVLIYSWIELDFVIGFNASILGNWAARISGIYG